jgi:molecular chaperone DnaJ
MLIGYYFGRTTLAYAELRRLARHYVPLLNGNGRGNLYVHLDVKVPTRLSREQRKLLEQLRDTLPVDNAPTEKGLFEKVKNYFM